MGRCSGQTGRQAVGLKPSTWHSSCVHYPCRYGKNIRQEPVRKAKWYLLRFTLPQTMRYKPQQVMHLSISLPLCRWLCLILTLWLWWEYQEEGKVEGTPMLEGAKEAGQQAHRNGMNGTQTKGPTLCVGGMCGRHV